MAIFEWFISFEQLMHQKNIQVFAVTKSNIIELLIRQGDNYLQNRPI